jgi:hypothetical protein
MDSIIVEDADLSGIGKNIMKENPASAGFSLFANGNIWLGGDPNETFTPRSIDKPDSSAGPS